MAALSEAQKFYTSWNQNGLRLTWTGANWAQDGDLFIYFDSQAGGTERLYNPYPASQNDTIVLLPAHQQVNADLRDSGLTPRMIRQQAGTNQMAADYMLWVEEGESAILMAWNGNDWETVAQGQGQALPLRYDFDAADKTTDIYLPFELLGISNPATASLGMVALASEEDSLRLWATMPAGNHVSSQGVVKKHHEGLHTFILNKRYEWPSLSSGICPSGVKMSANQRTPQRTGDPVQFTGADVRSTISAEPLGIGYSVLNDDLIHALDQLFAGLTDWEAHQNELCQANQGHPDCERLPLTELARQLDFHPQEGLGHLQDTEHALVSDGQELSYQIRLTNRGSQPATGVKVNVATSGPVILPDATYQKDDFGEFYTLELDVGTLGAGEERTLTFTGIVDTSFDSDNHVGWATIDVILYDDTGDLYRNQLEWLYLDHELDDSAPDHLELQAPVGVLAAGVNELRGFVSDGSSVPTFTLEVETGTISRTTCLNETPDEQQWACEVTITGVSEGDNVRIRAQATDIHGQTSEWSSWHSFIVDATGPTISLDSTTESALMDDVIGPVETVLSGVLSDNQLISGVEVCQLAGTTQECTSADVIHEQSRISQTLHTVNDLPTSPITIDGAATCDAPIERTFNVTDNFTIADVDVGLNISHPYRNDLQLNLYSPAGTQVRLMAYAQAAQNVDTLFDDATTIFAQLDGSDHNITAPYYEHHRAPDERLSQLNGEQAEGEWKLTICDHYPDSHHGSYHHARLILTAQRAHFNTTGTWRYQLPIENNQSYPQTLTVYGVDEAGNRSKEPLSLNFTVDTIPPTVNATVPATHSRQDNSLGISGEARDSSGIRLLKVSILQPNGETVADVINLEGSSSTINHSPSTLPSPQPISGDNQLYLPLIARQSGTGLSTWQYNDTTHLTQQGTYTIWLEAEDNAGNSTELGPYQLELIGAQELYLPLIGK